MNNSPVLISILHDKDGKLLSHINANITRLKGIYSEIVVNVTYSTDNAIIHTLDDHCEIITSPKSDLSNARRTAVKYALEVSGASTFHYCDFDRVLYWVIHNSEELSTTVNLFNDAEFVVIGRSKKAMASHPLLQRASEGIVNVLFEFIASGYDIFDVVSGSRFFSREMAQLIINLSKSDGPCVDIEWPLLAIDKIGISTYYWVDELAYESDFFGIKRGLISEAQLRLTNLYKFVCFIYNHILMK